MPSCPTYFCFASDPVETKLNALGREIFELIKDPISGVVVDVFLTAVTAMTAIGEEESRDEEDAIYG